MVSHRHQDHVFSGTAFPRCHQQPGPIPYLSLPLTWNHHEFINALSHPRGPSPQDLNNTEDALTDIPETWLGVLFPLRLSLALVFVCGKVLLYCSVVTLAWYSLGSSGWP